MLSLAGFAAHGNVVQLISGVPVGETFPISLANYVPSVPTFYLNGVIGVSIAPLIHESYLGHQS